MLKLERVVDSINALALKGVEATVHTKDGGVGRIVKTEALKGKITVELNSGEIKVFPGRDVADLDCPL